MTFLCADNPERHALQPRVSVIVTGDGFSYEKGAAASFHGQTVAVNGDAYRAALSADGEFLLFVPGDSVLTADAHTAFLTAAETADFVYADDAALHHGGTVSDPRCKPGPAPETLLSAPYIGFPFLVSAPLFRRMATRRMLEDPELTELSLTLSLSAKRVRHIPRVLLWRKSRFPVLDGAPVAHTLERLGIPAFVSDGLFPGSFRIRYPYPENARVAVLVGNRYPAPVLRRTLETLERGSVFDAYDLIIVNTREGDSALDRYLRRLSQNRAARVLHLREETSPPQVWNRACKETDAPYLLFLDAAYLPQGCDDIESLLEWCQDPAAGAVGGMLKDPFDGLQSCGMVVGLHGGIASPYRKSVHAYDPQRNRFVHTVRDVSVLPVCGMLTARKTFLTLGGFDTTLPVGYAAAFCLRLLSEGLRCVYTPYAVFRQHADSPQPGELSADNDRRLTDLFRDMLKHGDPYFHPRWDMDSDSIRLAEHPQSALALHRKGVWFP